MPIDVDHVLEPLIATMGRLVEREDKIYETNVDSRGDVSYASSETLLAVARIFPNLGSAARPAIPVIEDCAKRTYVAGASDKGEWRDILKAIGKR